MTYTSGIPHLNGHSESTYVGRSKLATKRLKTVFKVLLSIVSSAKHSELLKCAFGYYCISAFSSYIDSSSDNPTVLYLCMVDPRPLIRLKQPSATVSIQSFPCVPTTFPSGRTLYILPSSLHDTLFPSIAKIHIGKADVSLTSQAMKKCTRKPEDPGPS